MTTITANSQVELNRKKTSQLKNLFMRLLRSKTGIVGLLIVISMMTIAIFAPYFAMYDPAKADIVNRLHPPFWLEGGTDGLPTWNR